MRISLSAEDNDRVRVRVNPTSKHEPFIVLEIGHTSIYFPGYGEENIKFAKNLAAELNAAAILCSQTMANPNQTESNE